MRILESCTSAWPMQDMQNQIDALREAFSADTSRPFELKPSFPYGSPSGKIQPSPPLDTKYQHAVINHQESHGPTTQQVQYHSHHQPVTPPISSEHIDHDRPLGPSLLMMTTCQQPPMSMTSNPVETDQTAWNPTPIFEYGSNRHDKKMVKCITNKSRSQWNTAFETPPSVIDASNNSLAPHSPPLYAPLSVGSNDLPPLHDNMQQQHYSAASSMAPLSRVQPVSSQSSYTSAGPSFVTSSMWRDTVANTYDPNGLKRRWDIGSSFLTDPAQAKRPR